MRSSWVAFVISLLVSIFCAVVWLNNVYLSWIRQIWKQEEGVSSAITGLHPLFDFFCVDHSTVSTFIPFFSVVWLTITFCRIGLWTRPKAKRPKSLKEEFPYFLGYNEWMVALGLMGTVWGLIMIGYLPNLDNLNITDLIGALHTALFSTLVALIWVYIIVLRLIHPFMHWYAARQLKFRRDPVTDSSLEEAIKKLANNLERLNDVLVDSTDIIDQFRKKITIKKIKEAEEFFKACTKALPAIETACKEQLGQLEEIKNLIKAHIKVSNKHSGHLKTLIESQAAQNQNLASISNLMNQKDARDKRNRRLFGNILKVFKGFNED